MKTSQELFEEALNWLRQTYYEHRFFVERDVVWTLQKRLLSFVDKHRLPYRIYNDYPIPLENGRKRLVDLCILDKDSLILLASEFKYEPDHARDDISSPKPKSSRFPVVEWGKDGVARDIDRIKEFIKEGKCQYAWSIFIDEGGRFKDNQPHPGSHWIQWDNKIWVLISQIEAKK
jgi:hypothetical protein